MIQQPSSSRFTVYHYLRKKIKNKPTYAPLLSSCNFLQASEKYVSNHIQEKKKRLSRTFGDTEVFNPNLAITFFQKELKQAV